MTSMRFGNAQRTGRLGDVPKEVRTKSASRARRLAPAGRTCVCGKELSRYNKGVLCSQCQDKSKVRGKART